MINKNFVFIGTSLDGFIADKNGGLEWLESIPNPNQNDMRYMEFIKGMDALIMGRNSFDTVLGFGIEWPYQLPVYVLSNSIKTVPTELQGKVFLVSGPLSEVLNSIHSSGHHNLYIDGGKTIQNFLKEDLIDEMILTTIPVLLGGGSPLFGDLENQLDFKLVSSTIFLEHIVQRHYRRIRE